MELLNLNQGEKVLVAHIVGERIVEVAELVERNKHGKIYKLKKDATVLVENPSKHDEGHFVVKHLRDAVEGHEVYEVPVIKDKLLRRSCRSEEHTSELQSRGHLVCRLLIEKKKQYMTNQ